MTPLMPLPVILGAVRTCAVSAVSGSIELDSNTGKKSHTSERDRLFGKFFFSTVGIKGLKSLMRDRGKIRDCALGSTTE